MDEKILERLAVCETNDINIFHQLKEIKSDVRDMHDLAASVKVIATKTEDIDSKVDKIDKRIFKVERMPTEDHRYYKRVIVGGIITTIIGIVIGAVFALILK